jgi:ABC-2 type transport system ATP-binding protein
VALSFGHDAERAGAVLRDRALVAQVDDYGASAEVRVAEGAEPDQLLSRLVNAGVGLLRFEVVEPSLNSIFIAKVGADAAVARAEEVALA